MSREINRALEALTTAQWRVLVASKAERGNAGLTLVPAHVERKRWDDRMVGTYSPAFRRLTTFGMSVRDAARQRAGLPCSGDGA